MTDIHCHILPGADDGAETMEDAVQMARMAAHCTRWRIAPIALTGIQISILLRKSS